MQVDEVSIGRALAAGGAGILVFGIACVAGIGWALVTLGASLLLFGILLVIDEVRHDN